MPIQNNTKKLKSKAHAHGYSSESNQQELSNEYQHDKVWMVFKDFCILMRWTRVASALDSLNLLLMPVRMLVVMFS